MIRRIPKLLIVGWLTVFCCPSPTMAADPPESTTAQAADLDVTIKSATKPDCCSRQSPNGVSKAVVKYDVPDVTLVNQNGDDVPLRAALSDSRPIVMQFAFTSCSTICPVASGTLASTQKRMGGDAKDVRFYTISIDPQHDTPERLTEYAEALGAGDGWEFLTGDSQDIVAVQKAFAAYIPNKSSHEPLTFLKSPKSKEWIRLTGLPSSTELTTEVRGLLPPDAIK